MDVDLQPLPALTYTTIGGIIDLYIFTGPTVQNVIEQYWEIIGKPTMPPYWSLGFHLCRYGYNTIDNMIATIRRMDEADFPYDVQWTDIDAMSKYLDFTYDETNFRNLPDLVRQLQSNGMHYVNIIDPAISSVQTPGEYFPYDDGVERGIFMKKFNSTEIIIGKVWPGLTAFPDFTHPNTNEWWTNIASKFHDIVPFDGMWIDMNEPSSFLDGSTDGCTNSPLDNPPFTPNVLGGNLNSKTLCPSAQQYLSSHYDLHSMFGYFEAKASNAAMKQIRNKRPFILSRSSFAGSGQFTAHWTGDNRATFNDMYFSIPAILNFNMFGIPLVGADICGFGLETTEELCTRWMQLGAFYPFMRNHNDLGEKDQDPASFSWEAQQIMKEALLIRYSLIPFWYTLHYEATTFSRTVVQPLFFEYPDDETVYNIDQQFLIGRALLVSPNLQSESNTVHAYIPSDIWYEFPSGTKFQPIGTFVDLDAPLSKINVHLRGGFIIPMKIPGDNLIIGRDNPFTLLIAQSQSKTASGSLFWDDGDSIEMKSYNYLNFSVSDNVLTINVPVRNYNTSMRLEIIKILGVDHPVTNVKINGKPYTEFLYNIPDQILLIYGLDLDMLSTANQIIQWTTTTNQQS
jgi:lysosomal alpha-glucosidase